MLKKIKHIFVEPIPESLEEGMLYISIKSRVSKHLCYCGCGELVIVIFSPTDWQLIFNGPTISIQPSIGNWQYNCKSHYFVTENNVVVARKMTSKEIADNRKQDFKNKERFYKKSKKNIWDKFWRN